MKKVLIVLILAMWASGCSKAQTSGNQTAPAAQATPSNKFTEADVAKLKWIEGTWRGMDGDKPFYERYRFEGSTLIVDGFADGTLQKINDTSRFELKNGEFGQGEGEKGSRASSITDTSVQFGPAVAGKGNYFRFEKQTEGTWNAILEWPATSDKPARQKIYKMEPYVAPK
jgi:hypothetical protein